MYVELIAGGFVGDGAQVLRIPCTQVVVFQDNHTPIAAIGNYGPTGSQLAAIAGDDDFDAVLHKLGVRRTVVVDSLKLPSPVPGARLLRGTS